MRKVVSFIDNLPSGMPEGDVARFMDVRYAATQNLAFIERRRSVSENRGDQEGSAVAKSPPSEETVAVTHT